MKIIHTVLGYYPQSGGSEEVVRRLSEYLVSFGHEVTVVTGADPRRQFTELNGVRIKEFQCSGNAVSGIHGESEAYRRFLLESGADVVMNYAAQIWSTDLVFDILDRLRGAKVLVPCGYSRLHDPLFADYYAKMPDILRKYNRVVYLSDNYIDAEFGVRHGLKNGLVIPNGADLKEFEEQKRGAFRLRHGLADRKIILNVSNHGTLKGHGFFWNCVKKLDRQKVAPVLIGNAFARGVKKWLTQCYAECQLSSVRTGGLMLEGYPRKGVVEAFLDADVFLFGSLVECSPLVMFESFASKTLFITTDCGNVKDYSDIICLVRDEKDAHEVLAAYTADPGRFEERIERGYALVHERLNWEAIAREYERMYLGILDERRGEGRSGERREREKKR